MRMLRQHHNPPQAPLAGSFRAVKTPAVCQHTHPSVLVPLGLDGESIKPNAGPAINFPLMEFSRDHRAAGLDGKQLSPNTLSKECQELPVPAWTNSSGRASPGQARVPPGELRTSSSLAAASRAGGKAGSQGLPASPFRARKGPQDTGAKLAVSPGCGWGFVEAVMDRRSGSSARHSGQVHQGGRGHCRELNIGIRAPQTKDLSPLEGQGPESSCRIKEIDPEQKSLVSTGQACARSPEISYRPEWQIPEPRGQALE